MTRRSSPTIRLPSKVTGHSDKVCVDSRIVNEDYNDYTLQSPNSINLQGKQQEIMNQFMQSLRFGGAANQSQQRGIIEEVEEEFDDSRLMSSDRKHNMLVAAA